MLHTDKNGQDITKSVNIDALNDSISTAVKDAQQDLLDQGVGYVYCEDDELIEHTPDGKKRVLKALNKENGSSKVPSESGVSNGCLG
jgi:hypothetical protein